MRTVTEKLKIYNIGTSLDFLFLFNDFDLN